METSIMNPGIIQPSDGWPILSGVNCINQVSILFILFMMFSVGIPGQN